jgi:hypothetical protein
LYQLVHLQSGALHLVREFLGGEAALHVVALRSGELLDAGMGAMVVRHHQAARRHEGCRASLREARRGEADVLQPGVVGLEAVAPRQLVLGKLVQEPHPLVGTSGGGQGDSEEAEEGQASEKGGHRDYLHDPR